MSGSERTRRVVSVYLADVGARDALRRRWPALSLALDALAAGTPGGYEGKGESAFLLEREQVEEISSRWKRGPWGGLPGRLE